MSLARTIPALLGLTLISTLAQAQASPGEALLAAEIDRARALDEDGFSEEALDVLENTARMPELRLVLQDRIQARRLTRAVREMHAPGAEPEWFYAGAPLLGVGLLTGLGTAFGTLVTCLFGCPGTTDQELWGRHAWVYGLAGTAALAGLVLILIGVGTHTMDPERRAFEERRHALRYVIRNVMRTGTLTLSF